MNTPLFAILTYANPSPIFLGQTEKSTNVIPVHGIPQSACHHVPVTAHQNTAPSLKRHAYIYIYGGGGLLSFPEPLLTESIRQKLTFGYTDDTCHCNLNTFALKYRLHDFT